MSRSAEPDPTPDFDRLNLREPENFGNLYDYFAPRLWRHIVIRTSSRDDTDDILAKVFLRTWEYVRSRRRVRNIKGFLYKTADHLIIDFYRRRAASVVHLADFSELLREETYVMPALDEVVARKHDIGRVMEAMKLLDGDEQRLLTLRFVDDLSLEETAEVIRKSKGATAVAVHRALRRLREALETRFKVS